MRYVTYSDASGKQRPGVLEGNSVRPFGAGVASLDAFIALDASARATELKGIGAPIALSSVKLHSPLHPTKNIFCVGRNYLAHAEEGARARNEDLKLPTVPTFFTKAPTAIADPDATLNLSGSVSKQYDWEAELAIVIGKRCKDVPEDKALDVIFGYTCLNDATARDLQRAHVQWFKGKSLDDLCPIGPWIVDAAEMGDAQNKNIALRVNGKTMQSSNTKNMIFSLKRIIAELSRGMTLEPGDVIASGTPEGVGFAMEPPQFLADGDVMEVDVEGIGVLKNTVHITA